MTTTETRRARLEALVAGIKRYRAERSRPDFGGVALVAAGLELNGSMPPRPITFREHVAQTVKRLYGLGA
jgi:hypothetical protein